MSFSGKNPSINSNRFNPLAVDPVNPRSGDVYYSNGTPRDEGLWVYDGAAWVQISTSGNLSVLASLTLTPQSSDPGSPAEGMLFMSNGTPRAEGIWLYVNSGWTQVTGLKYQEFVLKEPVEVRLATTANLTLASQLENGDTIDGVVLATGDLVLVKNQTTTSDNGVYVVAASGAPSRHSSADTYSELNNYAAYIGFGTANKNTLYYQTSTLTSLASAQTWATTPATQSFTVPNDVWEIAVEAVPAGGAGGGSARNSSTGGAGAGGGGAGAVPVSFKQAVSPGDSVTVTVGKYGVPVRSINAAGSSTAADGGQGGNTVLAFSGRTITLEGALGGGGGSTTVAGPGADGAACGLTYLGLSYTDGGMGSTQAVASNAAGQNTIYASGGSVTNAVGRGGGGGAGRLAGAAGTAAVSASAVCAAASSGAGGAGAPDTTLTTLGTRSGWGGSGYVRFSWE